MPAAPPVTASCRTGSWNLSTASPTWGSGWNTKPMATTTSSTTRDASSPAIWTHTHTKWSTSSLRRKRSKLCVCLCVCVCYLGFPSCALLHQASWHGTSDGEGLEERADEVTQSEGNKLLRVEQNIQINQSIAFKKVQCVRFRWIGRNVI